jgi:predicted MPP superfamily phosphohydrolase
LISRRRFLKISLGTALTTAIGGLSAFAYAHDIEPRWVEINPVELTLPRLDRAFEGYRLVQISDIHMGTGMNAARLLEIAGQVNAQEPDAVVITGDFVTHGGISLQLPALRDGLRPISARDGVFAILGNHDHWTDERQVRGMLAEAGVADISNGLRTIQRGQSSLHIAGVDDYWERKDRLDDVLAMLPPDDQCAILLAHEPDYADISAATGRFDLQLSGHSHGGQVIIPFIGPPILPAYSYKYPVGQYQVGSMIQYTNRGLGTVAPMVRFNCRPEITVFTLRDANGATSS